MDLGEEDWESSTRHSGPELSSGGKGGRNKSDHGDDDFMLRHQIPPQLTLTGEAIRLARI